MEQKGDQLDQETFSCSICLDLLKDPVAVPCGHSYCMSCIETHWDEEDQKGVHSCPQCRLTFIPRPVLKKNIMLSVLVEQLKKTGLQAAPADHSYAGPEDVACDVCSGRKLKAIKSCLVCLASYCEKHLQPHYESAPLQKHKLVEPSKNLQENICPLHDEVMKMFCRTDQKCICYLCSVEEHRGHDTVSAAAERTERQRELEVRRGTIQQEIQDREKDVELLQQEVEAIHHSADKTVEDSEEIFTQLVRLIEKRSSDVKQQVRSQQETEVSRVLELQEKLEQEITELKRKDAELKQLSHTEDHNQFLHNSQSVSALGESPRSSSFNIRPLRYFEDVTAAVEELRDKLQDTLRDTWTNVSLTVSEVDFLLSEPEPKSRAGFFRCSCETTLDPNTANTHLLLSERNRKVTGTDDHKFYSDHPDSFIRWSQPGSEQRESDWSLIMGGGVERNRKVGAMNHPLFCSDHPDKFTRWWQVFDHPDRFIKWRQVLSRESLTGRCYWEVEWRGKGASVAVTYKSISRTGDQSKFGCNDKSWALYCSPDSFIFRHNNIQTSISGPGSSRIGVYLDHTAGVLSFYRVSETRTLLHRVQTTFTQPLHAGLWVSHCGDSAEFCELK